MTATVISALLISIALYLVIGAKHSRYIKKLADILPLKMGTRASVSSSAEFSASTVATTISLATVIVAFFELVPGLGWWLLWPGITTALGLLLFGFLSKRIWKKFEQYDHRPSMHEYLGIEFNSKSVAIIASIFTAIGYLSAFAVELTVGSRFLAALVPSIPQWATVLLISAVAFTYTSLGGFRTVVVTDRFQMAFIWLLLGGLIAFFMWFGSSQETGFAGAFGNIPDTLKTISYSKDLLPFIFGILVMNLFTYVGNMGLWQRVAGSQKAGTVEKGTWASVVKSVASWSLFVVVAIGAYMIVSPVEGENLLLTLIKAISNSGFGKMVVFLVVLGLFGAMLSTASTQLIAVSHTIYEDLIGPFRKTKLSDRLTSKKEVTLSRVILVVSAVLAVGVVELLRIGGFSVADLAFAVYGAALGLVPPILVTLFENRDVLEKMHNWASAAVLIGFSGGWVAASAGKILKDGNLVFLAPCTSLGLAGIVVLVGWILARAQTRS